MATKSTTAAKKTEPEEEVTYEEWENLPDFQGDLSETLASRLVKGVHEIRTLNSTILANSTTEEAVTEMAKNGDDPRIAEKRTERDETEKRIAEIREEIRQLTDKSSELYREMRTAARYVLSEQVDTAAKDSAQKEKTGVLQKMNATITLLMGDEEGNSDVGVWISQIRREMGSGNSGTNHGPAKDKIKKWNDRVREWARNNGMAVSDRGRLPENVLSDYETANPGDPKPE